jgi:hypothetical protein
MMKAVCRAANGLLYYRTETTYTGTYPTDWFKWKELSDERDNSNSLSCSNSDVLGSKEIVTYGSEQFILADETDGLKDSNYNVCSTRGILASLVKGPKLASVYRQEDTSQQSLF